MGSKQRIMGIFARRLIFINNFLPAIKKAGYLHKDGVLFQYGKFKIDLKEAIGC
jgi:hypothetical protein